MKRILTGTVLILVMTGSILISSYTFLILIILLNLLSLNEFYTLFRDASPKKVQGLFLSLTLLISFILIVVKSFEWSILFLNIPIVFAIFVSELFTGSLNPFQKLGITFLGILYVTFPCIFLASIPFLPFESETYWPDLILGFFMMVWASDSGAYLAGKKLGKHPLFLRISPKKTWEGSIGGELSALIVAFAISFFFKAFDRSDWIILSLIIIVAGTFGDLVKSMMKRSLGIKDSGKALPGHGGFLDRFDSAFGSAPFVFCYIFLLS